MVFTDYNSPHTTITASGIDAIQVTLLDRRISASDVRLVVLYTYCKVMSEVFAQLSGVTSATSLGSANVISTHCDRTVSSPSLKEKAREI